jgi:hypothetical protein
MKDVAFITLTNSGYIDYTLNCLESLKRIGLSSRLHSYVIGKEGYDLLKEKGYKCSLIEDEKNSNFQTFRKGNWSDITFQKFIIIHENLKKYKYVCFTDGDIVFENKNFLEYLRDNIKSYDMLIHNEGLNDNDTSNLCSGFMYIKSNKNTLSLLNPEIVKDYPDVSPKTQSLMCAFREIADHFPSIKYTLAEGKNIFHYLALSTIQSKGVGIRSKATSFLSSGFKTETQTKTRDQEIMDTVLQFLCKETTPPNQIFPSRLKQFLQGNAGIQQMLSEQDLYGKTPIRIVTSQNESIAKNSCFINNIKTTQSGGKSRRSRKQNKQALAKSKQSKKSRKNSRK